MNSRRYISSKTDPLYKTHGWSRTNVGFEKDGYEIYLIPDGGFELTVRDPETGEREAVFKREDIDHKQPLTVAFMCYLLENAEHIAVSERQT